MNTNIARHMPVIKTNDRQKLLITAIKNIVITDNFKKGHRL